MTRYLLDGVEQTVVSSRVTVKEARRQEEKGENSVVVSLMTMGVDSAIHGVTVRLPPDDFVDGYRLVIDQSRRSEERPGWHGAITWSVLPEAVGPEHVITVYTAVLELYAAGATPGAAVSGRFYGVLWGIAGGPRAAAAEPQAPSLIINEVAARGEPRDWFELYNASGVPLALADFVLADDLTDRSRRIPFLPDLRIEPGAYLRVELDSDRWPGFALGRDEELGIWTGYGRPVAQVDWQAGDSGRGTSYARVPDLTGPFRTVADPTPGAPNPGALIDLTPVQPPIIRFWSALTELAAGDRGAPAASGGFDLYLDEAGTELTYHKAPCAPEDLQQERFYLHVFPADPAELAAAERQSGFSDRAFRFDERGVRWSMGNVSACVALVPLPAYEHGIARIRTGQGDWSVEFPVRE